MSSNPDILPSSLNYTCLHAAVFKGYEGFVSIFREWTPLLISVYNSKLEMLKFLLSQNADPWFPDNEFFRRTAAHRAAEISPQSLRILLACYRYKTVIDKIR